MLKRVMFNYSGVWSLVFESNMKNLWNDLNKLIIVLLLLFFFSENIISYRGLIGWKHLYTYTYSVWPNSIELFIQEN